MHTIHDDRFGRVQVRTLVLPEHVKAPSGTYLPSGHVLVDYRREEDHQKDFLRLAVVNDDGTGFREIFAGVIPQHEKANGIRFMPYLDNRRVLLGDYVLEADEDLGTAKSVRILPILYPWGLQENPRVFKSWSEIIISPDMEHICWTILLTNGGASVALGKLVKADERYEILDAVVISSDGGLEEDRKRPGYVLPKRMLGGEVKQFVRGGTAISAIGAGTGALTDSVVQDLRSGKLESLTNCPGYEETTILSPDERLGMVMSTRASDSTNFAILGLLPRPHAALVTMGLSLQVYMFAVASVRSHRQGNVGPVLIDVAQSMADHDYMGIPLNDPSGAWVYLSPMSWHPSGQKAMWPEMKRGEYSNKRLRIVELPDVVPGPPVPAQQTPLDIPYARTGQHATDAPQAEAEYRIAGQHSGEILFRSERGLREKIYRGYSDDGTNTYDGYERLTNSNSQTVYEAKLNLTGPVDGGMDCRLTFSGSGYDTMPELVFEPGEDGLAQTRGYARYGDKKIDVAIMR